MSEIAALKTVGYFVLWIIIGVINFMAAVRLEGMDSEAIEQNDKLFAVLVVVWPLVTVSMIAWAFNKMRKGEQIEVGGKKYG